MVEDLRRRQRAPITDASGDSGLGLHRPGFRIDPRARRDTSFYDAAEEEMQNAWRTNNSVPTGAGSNGPRRRQEGDSCTIAGSSGHLVDGDGELICVTDDEMQGDAMLRDALLRDAKQRAYAAYEATLQNAWRTGK